MMKTKQGKREETKDGLRQAQPPVDANREIGAPAGKKEDPKIEPGPVMERADHLKIAAQSLAQLEAVIGAVTLVNINGMQAGLTMQDRKNISDWFANIRVGLRE